jgi:hypothetical protein
MVEEIQVEERLPSDAEEEIERIDVRNGLKPFLTG